MLERISPEMIRQFFKFCVVGGTGMVVDFGITWFLKEVVRINKYAANSIGFLCAATSNWLLNRIWTFQSADPRMARQYLLFIGIALIGLAINNGVIWLLHGRLKFNFYLAKLFAIGIVTFWNFFMNYFFNFSG